MGDVTECTVDFGQTPNHTHYAAGAALADALEMTDVVDFDANGADVFPVTYNVTYENNADSLTNVNVSTDGSATVQSNRTIAKLPTGTADGKSIASWNTAADGSGTTVTTDTPITPEMVSGDPATLTLYAQWADQYNLTIDGNGGKTADNETSLTYPAGVSGTDTLTSLTKPEPEFERADYTFDAWYKATEVSGTLFYDPTATDAAISDVMTEPIDGTQTWFANWTAAGATQYTVTFHENNGTTETSAYATRTVNANDKINASGAADGENMPAHPTRANYDFAGWNTQANGAGTDFTGATAVAAATDVYAKWTPAAGQTTVTVNVDTNGGSAANPESFTVIEGTTVNATILPDTPTLAGHTFSGWFVDDVATGAQYDAQTDGAYTYVVNSTITIKAKWSENVKVTLHDGDDTIVLEGAVGDMLTDFNDYTTQYAATGNIPAKTNYTFQGWFDAAKTLDNKDSVDTYTGEKIAKDDIATGTLTSAMNNKDLYAWYMAPVKVSLPGDETHKVSYTGSVIPTSDLINVLKFEYWNVDDSVAAGEATLAEPTQYKFIVGNVGDSLNADSTSIAVTNAGEYQYLIVPVDPELQFMEGTEGTFNVSKKKLDLTLTTTAPSDGNPDGSYNPKPTVTLTDPTQLGDMSDTDKQALLDTVGFDFFLINPGAADKTALKPTDVTEQTKAATLGDYLMTVSLPDGGNYEVGTINGPAQVKTDATAEAPSGNEYQLAGDFYDTTGDAFEPGTPLYVFTVEPDSHKVTFKIPQATNNKIDADAANVTLDATAYAEKTVKHGEDVQYTDGVTPAVGMPADPTKLDDVQFAGWFVVAADGTYSDAKDAYDAWKADPTNNAAKKFTDTTKVEADMTVVAYWTTSTDATLPDPDDDDPANPGDPVTTGGLVLTIAAENGTELGYVTTTDSDFTTAKPFASSNTTQEYWGRVANNAAKLNVIYETAEPGSTIAFYKSGDRTQTLSVYTVPAPGALTTMADGTKPLDLAVTTPAAPTNDFDIVVTAPDGTSSQTYTLHIQRLAKAEIKLNYGNSPYGMIMKDPDVNTANAAYGKTDAEKDTWREAAKTEFNTGNKFTAGYTPLNAPTDKTYTVTAWTRSTDSTVIANPDVNMDRNEYAIFIYNGKTFKDPGFTAINSLGETVDAANVTRTMTVNRMNGTGDAAWTNVTAETDFTLTENASGFITNVTSETSRMIRPDIYEITYTFTDYDGTTKTATRKVVVLNLIGEVTCDGSYGPDDGNRIHAKVGGTEFTATGRSGELLTFRIADVSSDGSVAPDDGNLAGAIVGGTPVSAFYLPLN